mmetsp:Transcript_70806/g.110825  ORF Transcript_70806/g.110825 Transcript_70806/m.110825 type:complete len:261 (-) Transcript_70806:79-861(-)
MSPSLSQDIKDSKAVILAEDAICTSQAGIALSLPSSTLASTSAECSTSPSCKSVSAFGVLDVKADVTLSCARAASMQDHSRNSAYASYKALNWDRCLPNSKVQLAGCGKIPRPRSGSNSSNAWTPLSRETRRVLCRVGSCNDAQDSRPQRINRRCKKWAKVSSESPFSKSKAIAFCKLEVAALLKVLSKLVLERTVTPGAAIEEFPPTKASEDVPPKLEIPDHTVNNSSSPRARSSKATLSKGSKMSSTVTKTSGNSPTL